MFRHTIKRNLIVTMTMWNQFIIQHKTQEVDKLLQRILYVMYAMDMMTWSGLKNKNILIQDSQKGREPLPICARLL
jgi:hypothetical protein